MSKKNTLLWEINGLNLNNPSYLFGTMHVQDLRAFAKLDFVKEKINVCEAFAAEYHLEERQAGMAQKMALPEGVSLKTLISPKKYQKLRKIILKTTKLDIEYFIQASPFMLTGLIGAQLLGKEMPISLDETLWAYAKGENKSMHGIETLEEQLNVLDKIPIPDQINMLLGIGKNIKRYRQHILHSAGLYYKSDLRRLSKSVSKNTGKLRKVLIYRRNEIMAERIAELVTEKSLFAAVGAGHLSGGKGVIRFLKQKGLKVTPV